MDVEASELQDWELLQPDPNSDNSGPLNSPENPTHTDEIRADSVHFTVDVSEDSDGIGSDSGVGQSGGSKFEEYEEKDEILGNGSEESEEITQENEGDEIVETGTRKTEQRGLLLAEKDEILGDGSEESEEKTQENEGDEVVGTGTRKSEEERRCVVWWKVPFEVLRCSVLRVNNPVWRAFSVAAAVLGFVFLSRRLYRMRKKTRRVEIKVAMDNKGVLVQKVSPFMSRAVHLRETFSAVRVIPVIRSQLPTGGVTPWSVLPPR